MNRPSIAGLILLVLLGHPPATRAGEIEIEKDPPARGGYLDVRQGTCRFTVATYNVRARPLLDETALKFPAVAPLLNAFDVVALQECFSGHRLLWRSVTHPVRVHDGSHTDWLRLTSSGLCTLSRLPLRETIVEKFEQPDGLRYLFRAKNDGLASKGIVLTRFDLGDGMTLDFYNTHMEAGGDAASNEVRRRQTLQIIRMVRRQSPPEHAVIVAGDFNMRPSGSKKRRAHPADPTRADDNDRSRLFRMIMRELNLTDAAHLAGDPAPPLIDHILYRSGSSAQLVAVSWKRDTRRFRDSAGQPWSDHDPIIATFRASRPR